MILFAFTAHTITVKHGTGNIATRDGLDKTLSETIPLILRKVGSTWYEWDFLGTIYQSKITNLVSDLAAKYSSTNRQTSIVNSEISVSAAIAYSKLNLTGAIVDGDLAGSIAQSKITNLTTDLAAKEATANKDANSGYAGLDSSGKLKLAEFPTGNALEVLRRNTGNTALEFAAPTQWATFGSSYSDENSDSTSQVYWGIHGHWTLDLTIASIPPASTAPSSVALAISKTKAIKIKRIVMFVVNDGTNTGTYDIGLYNYTQSSKITTALDGTTQGGAKRLDSGAIDVSVAAGDQLCFYFKLNSTPPGTIDAHIIGHVEYEYQ